MSFAWIYLSLKFDFFWPEGGYRPYTSAPGISTALLNSSGELQKPRGELIYVPAGKH
jgi:hypothetical protein